MEQILTQKDFEKPVDQAPIKILKFTNFTKEAFTWTWNKIPYTFKAGESKYMDAGIANHFAKHLVNQELLARGRENDTSPKVPKDNPFFMELYNRCISPVVTDGPVDQTKLEQEIIDRNVKEALGIKTEEAPAPAPEKEAAKAPEKAAEEDEKFEVVDVEDEEDAPPATPSNLAAKGAKKGSKKAVAKAESSTEEES